VRADGVGGLLMYTPEAIRLRRCRGTRADGSPCRAWAIWGEASQQCVAHCGRPGVTRRGSGNYRPYQSPRTARARYQPCRCVAYAWPHRPGGGLCQWPIEPTYRLTREAGRHSSYWSRTSRAMKVFGREYRAWVKTGRLPRMQDPAAGTREVRRQRCQALEDAKAMTANGLQLVNVVPPASAAAAVKGSESAPVVPPTPERSRSGKHLSKTNSSAGRVA
jgi:hypothetical protein